MSRPRFIDLRPSAVRQQEKADDGFYRRAPWLKLRAAFLKAHPLCKRCEARDEVVPATHVHHIVERRVDPSRQLDWDNLEGLCLSCHSKHHGGRYGR